MILDRRAMDTTLDIVGDAVSEAEAANVKSDGVKPATLLVQTTRFGTLAAEEDLVLSFPEGLIGFEHCRRYIVVRHEENSSFRWLQSLDEANIAFPVLEPGEFRPDYAPTISDADANFLELSAQTPTLTFTVVTVPAHDPRGMTANLLSPLVINGVTRRGKQVIIQDEGYTTRHVILEELARTNTLAIAPVASSPQRPASADSAKADPVVNAVSAA